MNENYKIGLVDLLTILLKRKKTLFIGVVVFSCVGIIVSLIMPKQYTAEAVVLPPKKEIGALSSLLEGTSLPGMEFAKSLGHLGNDDADQFLSILKSRRIAEGAINRFNLIHYYRFDKTKKWYIEDVLKRLKKSVQISQDNYENITIAVTDTSPTVAADIANYFVKSLDTILYQITKEGAQNSRLFFAERIAIIKADLDSAAAKFNAFQVENNFIDLQIQSKTSIEAIAKLEADKMATDMELELMRGRLSSGSPQVVELEKNAEIMRMQIQRYLHNGNGDLLLPLKKTPALSVQYEYLYGTMVMQESLYKFARQMFERAKLTEANNTPVVKVLEWAEVPHKKSKPIRSMICMLFFFFGVSFTCLAILLHQWYVTQKNSGTVLYEKLRFARNLMVRKK